MPPLALLRAQMLLAATMGLTCLAGRLDDPPAKVEDNPYRRAKVGQWVEYGSEAGGQAFSSRYTVTAKDEKSVTLKIEAWSGDKALPTQTQTIPLDQPYDLKEVVRGPATENAKVEVRQLEKTEDTLEVGDNTYACTRTKILSIREVNGRKIESVFTIWTSPDVPLSGMVRWRTEFMGRTTDLDLRGFSDK